MCGSDKRLIKETLEVIFDNRQEGDILMDVDADLTWEQLQKQTQDKDEWRDRVKILKIAARRATAPVQTHTIKTIDNCSSNDERKISRFTFLPPKPAPARKGKKKQSNTKARKSFMQRT